MIDISRRATLITVLAAAAAVGGVVAITARSDERPAPRKPDPPAAPRWAAPAAGAKPPLIDVGQLRGRLPDSAYWRDGAPTDNPAEAARRAEDSRRWNALYGRVLEGTASQEEIDRYYDHLRRRSEDYLQLAKTALAQNTLSDRDRALFTLAARMNRDRLAALPAERQQALERKRLQDQRRTAWQATVPR